MRNEALHCVYNSVRNRLAFSFDEFERRLAGWEVVPLTQSGEVIGGLLVKGNEMHVGYEKTPTASIRPYIKRTLNRMIREHGFVVTKIDVSNERGRRFCERLGFVETHVDSVIHMRCDRSNYD